MNTPAHVMWSLALLARDAPPDRGAAVIAGALLPDAPMFVFYGVEKFVFRTDEHTIWNSRYYAPQWQAFIDAFNALPVLAIGLAVATVKRWRIAQAFFGSMILHALCDLPVHHDDGHRHLFPLSDWKFASPISYWDPAHYGQWVTLFEIGSVVLTGIWLWRSTSRGWLHGAVLTIWAIYASFFGFVFWMWVG